MKGDERSPSNCRARLDPHDRLGNGRWQFFSLSQQNEDLRRILFVVFSGKKEMQLTKTGYIQLLFLFWLKCVVYMHLNGSHRKRNHSSYTYIYIYPPKFNIDPEKWWLEDYFPIGNITFQGLC